MRTMCSREIITKKCRRQQIFDSGLKGAWHYNHVTFTPIAKNFMLYCRLIYMLSIRCVRLTIKVKVGIPESFKVGWYPPKKTGSSHLNRGCPLNRGCKIAQCLLTINIQRLLCTVIKLHAVQEAIQSSSSLPLNTYFNLSVNAKTLTDFSMYFKDVIQYYYCQFSPVSA